MNAPALAVAALLLMSTSPAVSAAPFWANHDEGWFFYNEITSDKEEPEETPPPTPSEVPAAKPAEPEKKVKLDAAWLRENLPKYLDKAIDEPTIENVSSYLYLQKLSLNKASAFESQFQRAVQLDPFLDENTRSPMLTAAATENNTEVRDHIFAALKHMSKETGLMFFYRSDCGPCMVEAPILKSLESQFGFSILPVSLDGRPLPRGEFPEYQIDSGQAAAIGVSATPALYLAYNGSLTPIGEGAIGFEDMAQKILIAGTLSQVLTEKDFDLTQPVKHDPIQMTPPVVDKSTLDSPDKLIAALRGRLVRGGYQ